MCEILQGETLQTCISDCEQDSIYSEECDDGNTSNNDLCKNDCTWNVCGDGYRNLASDTEECDTEP